MTPGFGRGAFWRTRITGKRRLLAAGIGVSLAVALATVSTTGAGRTTNLVLKSGLPETFIMMSKSRADRCYVVDRRDSTVRRSDRRLPGPKWRFVRFLDPEGRSTVDHWLLRSKRKGTILLVPVDAVEDWSYPVLHRSVRRVRKDLELPRAEWTQLFVNRYYRGLYLRVALPADPRKKDGGTGVLREMLTVSDRGLTSIDTRFGDAGTLYRDRLAEGAFPRLEDPDPVEAWLALRSPVGPRVFLMSNLPPYDLDLLPLPVSPSRLHEAAFERQTLYFQDERYERWTTQASRAGEEATNLFEPEEWERVRREFERVAASFMRSLATHARLHESPHLLDQVPMRQRAVSDLGLGLEAS